MFRRLVASWVYGGFLAGWLVLALTPLVAVHGATAFALAYLMLPIYMFHQFEEHDDDRFRREVNRLIGGDREALTPLAVFVINIGAVWALFAAALLAAAYINLGFALIPVYLTLVNALIHIAVAIRFRAYNPGLATAIALFLPFGVAALIAIHRAGVAAGFDLLGAGVAILVHVVIAVHVLKRRFAH